MGSALLRVFLLATLLVSSCTPSPEPPAPIANSTSATPGTDTTAAASSTTSEARTSIGWPEVELLVTNADGVHAIDTTGRVSQLVTGRVAFAVDDTRGGLLFQVERGRSASWWYGESDPELPAQDTRVWWVPRGSSQAQELLVPTPGEPHDLSLQDAFVDGDGNLRVLYTRHDSTFDPEVGPFTFADSLRTYSVDSRTVDEVITWPGYEAGIGSASGSTEAIAVTLYGQIESECVFLDPLNGEPVQLPGAPVADPRCEADCPQKCVASDEWLAYGQYLRDSASVTAAGRAGRTRSFEVERLVGLDLSGSYLLVTDRTATLVDLRTGDSWPVPLEGAPIFATASVELGGLVVPPSPAAIQLRPDGLGVVEFGDPVDAAMVVLGRALGPPDTDSVAEGPWDDGVTCFMATGFGCDDYFRLVSWGRLDVAFSDRHAGGTYRALVGWSSSDPRFSTLDGVRVGSSARELEYLYGSRLAWMWQRAQGIDFRIGAIYGTVDDRVPEPVPDGYQAVPYSRVTWLGAGALGSA